MMDSTTGELTLLKPNDPRISNPPSGHVIMFGSHLDVRRISDAVKERNKAKRKRQKESRKRNR